jgi:hypothetical protein
VAGAEVEEGDAAWVDTWARLVTMKVNMTDLAEDAVPHNT